MKKEKLIKRFLVSKAFFLIGMVVLGFLFFILGRKILGGYKINEEIKAAEQEIAKIEAKNIELNEFLNYLNTDAFLEQEARLKFNLQKPGESVAVVPEIFLAGNIKEGTVLASADNQQRNNPSKWWNYFFGK